MLADFDADVASGAVWFAERDGAAVGALTLRFGPDWALIDSIAVAPAQAGRGVGGALLDFAEAQARARGLGVRLYTHRSMVENQGWYRRRGYTEVPPFDHSAFDRVYFEKAP
jgi:ribosomal protein S18 acetylase RimI-like enzyme